MNLSADGRYFNAGVMLLNLDELKKENFTDRSLEFFRSWKEHYRFWDNRRSIFLLQGQIEELPNIGIDHFGALTSRMTIVWTASSTTRVQCHGLLGQLVPPKNYLNDLQPRPVCL